MTVTISELWGRGLGIPAQPSSTSSLASYEALVRQRTSLVPTVTGQAGLIAQHSVGIAEFRGRLNIKSRNSPRPPSSDSCAKPAP